jgi:hypothetical protein
VRHTISDVVSQVRLVSGLGVLTSIVSYSTSAKVKSSDPCDESLVLVRCCLGCCSVILRSVCVKLPRLLVFSCWIVWWVAVGGLLFFREACGQLGQGVGGI